MNAKCSRTLLAAALILAPLVQSRLMAAGNASKTYSINQRFLNVPLIKDTEVAKKSMRTMTLTVDGRVLGVFQVPLALNQERYYGFFDLAGHQGQRLTIETEKSDQDALSGITLDEQIKDSGDLYREMYRPQFHFTARRGYLNDPNGLIYHDGEYHLYYQYNPLANYTAGANKAWGHAVSKDMIHWEEEPPVLFPLATTGACYSGASFIDRNNQLKRKTGKEDVIVAFYLRTKSGLSLAYSNDRGRTMTDYEQNPVVPLKDDGRIDTPRPFWFEPTGRWVAPVMDYFFDQTGKKRRCVGFYSSENLTKWEFESRVEQDKFGDELTGCVDFFQLPLDGDPLNKKWVMVFIDGSYIVGICDGKVFYTLSGKAASTSDRIEIVARGNFYATMTFDNAPNGRRVQVAWMASPPFPGMAFNQQMTVPSELTLHSTVDGPRMRMNPIQEITALRVKTHEWTGLILKPGEDPLAELKGELYDLEVEFVPKDDAEIVFDLRGHRVTYDSRKKTLTVGNDFKPRPEWQGLGRNYALGLKPVSRVVEPLNGVVRLRMLLDRTSVEVSGNDGRIIFPTVIFPDPQNINLHATCSKGEICLNYLRVHELKSIWR